MFSSSSFRRRKRHFVVYNFRFEQKSNPDAHKLEMVGVQQGETMLLVLDTRPLAKTDSSDRRDFFTCEDELPATVSLGAEGPLDSATRITEVKHETTDDN